MRKEIQNTHLLYEQFLAHGDALVQSLLVFLQKFLLFIDLPPQVTVRLLKKTNHGMKLICIDIN